MARAWADKDFYDTIQRDIMPYYNSPTYPPVRVPHMFVVALNYQQFLGWCKLEDDIPVNPHDKNVTFISTDASINSIQQLRGRHIYDDDFVVFYGQWDLGKGATEVVYTLLRAGWVQP